ncbi:MAG TPA: flagellin [Rugosimonospora sp.]|nr:flagellin [Rugosimonospora sp.]
MSLRINQNISAMNAYRNLSVTSDEMSKSLEKLSSGFRINRAADDAAGLSISEGLRAQIGGLQTAVNNAQDGISVVQTAEGALTEVHAILQRMRDLAVQASNTGSQDTQATSAAQTEFAQLNQELDRIGNTTSFGNTKLLDGTFGSTPGVVAQAVTGVNPSTGFDFSAMKLDFNGTIIDGTTIAASTQTAVLTGHDVDSTGAALAAGHYNSASHLQTDLQTAVDTTLATAVAGYHAGDVKVQVADAGNGVWKIALDTSSTGATTATGATLSVAGATAGDFGFGTTASTSNVTLGAGGVFQIGANAGETLSVSISAVNSTTLGTGGLNLTTNASGAISAIDTAISSVSNTRATLGAYQNRFEHTINNLNVAVENLTASESRIRDTDMAQEMVNFTRSQILSQAGTAMLAQANQAPQSVLKLLQ